jgi:protein-tyrosine phosphatase
LTARSLTGEWGLSAKKASEVFLHHNLAHVIASDAHDSSRRPPRLKSGVEAAAAVVGRARAAIMVNEIPQAILDDESLPDWGEPINPLGSKKRWSFRIGKAKITVK